MSSATGTVPDWLAAARSQSYLRSILKSLAERESIRNNARSISRPPLNRRGIVTSFSPTKTGLKALPVHYSVSIGCQPENALRNRYYQLEPYDRTRVVIGQEGRYINASWVLERFGRKWWIATQAPLPSTAHAFLSLIAQPSARPSPQANPQVLPPQSRVRTVVQLTQNFEGGRRKAHAYFPSEVGKSLVITPEEGCEIPALKVTLLESRTFREAHCIQSIVAIVPVNLTSTASGEQVENDDGEEISSQRVTFRHMLYTSWPDHGVPSKEDRASIIQFVRLVDRVNRDISYASQLDDPDPPIMVGCSAGIGRTGSFIAISSLLRYLGYVPAPSSAPTSALPSSPLGPLPASLANDLTAQEVDSLREQRPSMVERDEQLLFIYEVLAIALGAIG